MKCQSETQSYNPGHNYVGHYCRMLCLGHRSFFMEENVLWAEVYLSPSPSPPPPPPPHAILLASKVLLNNHATLHWWGGGGGGYCAFGIKGSVPHILATTVPTFAHPSFDGVHDCCQGAKVGSEHVIAVRGSCHGVQFIHFKVFPNSNTKDSHARVSELLRRLVH